MKGVVCGSSSSSSSKAIGRMGKEGVLTIFAMVMMMGMGMGMMGVRGWTCKNSCGGVPVQYPFGTGKGCGNPTFANFVNCSEGRLTFFTPTGEYTVISIDYTNSIMVVQAPSMPTCSSMQPAPSFGLPVSSPFSVTTTNTFVLLDCSPSPSSTQLCDPNGAQICESLYSCPGVSGLGLKENSPISTCCVYSSSQLASSPEPFGINLPLLECSSFTSVYSFGPAYQYGNGPPADYLNPSTWSYGIALKFSYNEADYYNSGCRVCQQSNGNCGFNVYGFICACEGEINSTTHCYGSGYVGNHGSHKHGGHIASYWIAATSILSGVMLLLA